MTHTTALAFSDEIWGKVQPIQVTQQACAMLTTSILTLLPQSCKHSHQDSAYS